MDTVPQRQKLNLIGYGYRLTDKSLVFTPFYTSAAYVIIYNNQIYCQSYNISSLLVESSTRVEIIALILALNDSRTQNCILPVEAYFALKQLSVTYISGRNFKNVHSLDLMCKREILNTSSNYSWVKGHSIHVGNNFSWVTL